ncbi:PP2C family protein-serine/threonine phosphatase [Stenotrophomonas maltophilia]|uniref:PP2C family protein-serine/threonine phosphatase n=1 Tax=Stenotrophomonas maltophilia TaxID=40324 RepID=UPI0009B2BE75|nr:protein phosphatase 2C domain-containing protein [Stenotrophomonas maltophilia]
MPLHSTLDEIGEQLLAELLPAPATPVPKLFQIGDGFAIGTHIGNKRSRNEDRVAIARVDIASQMTYSAHIICDGVGGSQRGDEAAAIACASIVSQLSSQTRHRSPAQLMPELIRTADDAVRLLLGGAGQTTLCMLLNSNDGQCALASIGDSRAYSWDQGSELIQLTEDDTLANEIKHHKLEHAQAYLNARGLEGSLSQALGEPGRTSNELSIHVLTDRSFPPGGILLATDGIWINDANAFNLITRHSRGPGELVRRLLTCASWLGGIDNASAIAIRDPQQMPETVDSPPRSTRITLWLADKQVVTYRSTAEFSESYKPPIEKQTKKRRKKTGAKPTQLELPDSDVAMRGNNIVAGPDDE